MTMYFKNIAIASSGINKLPFAPDCKHAQNCDLVAGAMSRRLLPHSVPTTALKNMSTEFPACTGQAAIACCLCSLFDLFRDEIPIRRSPVGSVPRFYNRLFETQTLISFVHWTRRVYDRSPVGSWFMAQALDRVVTHGGLINLKSISIKFLGQITM